MYYKIYDNIYYFFSKSVTLMIEDLDLEESYGCIFDALEISHENAEKSSPHRICSSIENGMTVISRSLTLLLSPPSFSLSLLCLSPRSLSLPLSLSHTQIAKRPHLV